MYVKNYVKKFWIVVWRKVLKILIFTEGFPNNVDEWNTGYTYLAFISWRQQVSLGVGLQGSLAVPPFQTSHHC